MTKLLITAIATTVMCAYPLVAQDKVTLSGYVKDGNNGEELIGVTVYVQELQSGVVTNAFSSSTATTQLRILIHRPVSSTPTTNC